MTLKQFTAVLLLSIWLPTAWEFLASEATCVCGQDFQTAKQANWHQWRGPDATGVASTATPPIRWNDQSNIRWKFPIVGEGSSTPIVWKNQVFILSAVETNRRGARSAPLHPEAKTTPSNQIFEFVVWSLDRRNGDVLWKRVVAESVPFEGRHPSTTYAAASPTTDGKRLYVSFGSYGIFCLSLQGDLIWKKDLGQMRTRRGWGEAVSPVYHNGKLAIMRDQEDQSEIFVLESNNGNIIWKNRRDEPTTWATPLIAPIDGKTQLITNGTNAVRSYDFETGDIIWETTGTTLNAIPCPVPYQDHVICMGGYQGNDAFSIDLRAKGKINDSLIGPRQAIKWRIQRHTPYVPSPLITGNRIYFTKSLNAILNCFNAESGEAIFKNEEGYPLPIRLPQLKQMYGSPVATKDFIFLTSREGTTLVIKNTARFEIVSTNSLTEEIDASPAIVGNQIFLRGKRNLYCIENASQK
jgi:outer membrane protein assembly factor BamB